MAHTSPDLHPRPHTTTPPELPADAEGVAPRPRVVEAFLQVLDRHPVVRVIAPAGSGKTTLLGQACSQIEHPVAWLTVDEWHRAPGLFLDDLVTALDSVVPGLRARLERERALEAGPTRAAALTGASASHGSVVLVLDDCHAIAGETGAEAVLGALLRHRDTGLQVVLSGRLEPSLPALGLAALNPSALIGEGVLRADLAEAETILLAHGSEMDARDALEATGGWIAGLVFESWRASDAAVPGLDPLAAYLEREVRPALSAGDDALLVDCSIFGLVDTGRLEALGCDEPEQLLERLRRAGIPATWTPDGQMRLHPRVRDILHGALEQGAVIHRAAVCRAAAAAYVREGEIERALAHYLECGDVHDAGRLLPDVIVEIVERGDLALAERYLDGVALAPEPASVVLARLLLASRRQSAGAGLEILRSLDENRLASLVAELPVLGAFACNFLPAAAEDRRIELVLRSLPPGRAADAARLILSLARDDPDAPIPAFTGDALDVIVARALFCRGKLRLLEGASESAGLAAGYPHFLPTREAPPDDDVAPLALQLSRVMRAVESRDLERAMAAIAAIEAMPAPTWAALFEAEIAIRLRRDPQAALAAVDRAPAVELAFYRELADVWKGAALLLQQRDEEAAAILRAAVGSMRRGDRTLALPGALVYLAEAEWRLGNEGEADEAADAAYRAAQEQGNMRDLMLALRDFPGVGSRRLDTESSMDSPWHVLARALVVSSAHAASPASPVGAHLHDLGEPVVALEGGTLVRAKIRKSLELLSFLLSRPGGRATRPEILTALWNGRDDDSSRAYLRQALRHLRDAVEPHVTIAAEGDALAVAGAVSADSLSLDALVGAAALEPEERRLGVLLDALELADRGTFLDGSHDVAWIDDRRARIDSLVADIRLDAAALLLDADRHLDALRLVSDALVAHPLLERGWRLQMTALALLGDNDGVAVTYARCRAVLAEIGLEPSATTTELARTLRR